MARANPSALEVEFVCLASRTISDLSLHARLQELSSQPLSWRKLEQSARKHGLFGLWAAWLELPVSQNWPMDFRSALKEESALQLKRNLQLLALLKMFDAGAQQLNVPYLVMKGPAFSTHGYGGLALRASQDLDILIRPEDYSRIQPWLRELALRPVFPLTPEQEQRWWDQTYAVPYVRDADGLELDLHSHAIPPGFSFRASGSVLFENIQRREVSGISVPVLDAERELSFLCWHAAKHNWERWSWVRDVDAAVRATPKLDWTRVEQEAPEWGGRALLGTSLELARRLFDTPIPAALRNAACTAAVEGALENLERLEDSRVFRTDAPLRSVLSSGSERRAHLGRILFEPGPADWLWVRLPDALRGLYYPLRPLRMLMKKLR